MNAQQQIKVFFKGMAMGAADAVPGVSGGTIAFIAGIYEQLLTAIRNINPTLIGLWRREGFLAVWNKVDGRFLVTLLAGILSSILLLAHLISFLLLNHPVLLSAFFFGLVLASVILIYRQIEGRTVMTSLGLIVGVVLMSLVNQLMPSLSIEQPWQVVLAGSIAICAMILPGISGSFLLLVMGIYGGIIQAVKSLDLVVLGLFATGCVVGLLSFSHVLSWLFTRFRAMTLAVLTGVLIGSLQQIWPWKQMLSYKLGRHGEAVPISQTNLFPSEFTALTGADAQLLPALVVMLLGFALVLAFELKGNNKN